MALVISLFLALVPLLGVLWIIFFGTLTTVDGLFMSLILLSMSGILGLNALYELRKRMQGGSSPSPRAAAVRTSAGLVQKGKVESVEFYESNVGQPNKSIVRLANLSHMLVFEGDLRNALPVGQRVEIAFRKRGGYNELLNVSYS